VKRLSCSGTAAGKQGLIAAVFADKDGYRTTRAADDIIAPSVIRLRVARGHLFGYGAAPCPIKTRVVFVFLSSIGPGAVVTMFSAPNSVIIDC
jgi:hypothetical protein